VAVSGGVRLFRNRLNAPANKPARASQSDLSKKRDLAEPADDMNGRNGHVVLTEKGKVTTERTDFERIWVRGLLREEMLHPLLRGRIFGYFTNDDPGIAVFEAFKTVEIEVRAAAVTQIKCVSARLAHAIPRR
jgi:hypothetical protein